MESAMADHGQATYTVDLSQLNQNNISYDENTKVATLTILKKEQNDYYNG